MEAHGRDTSWAAWGTRIKEGVLEGSRFDMNFKEQVGICQKMEVMQR